MPIWSTPSRAKIASSTDSFRRRPAMNVITLFRHEKEGEPYQPDIIFRSNTGA
jgi:hypothetical protein